MKREKKNSIGEGQGLFTGILFLVVLALIAACDMGGDSAGVAGYTDNSPLSGELDLSFDSGTGPTGSLTQIVMQSDGKILICGDFTQVAGVSRNYLARLNADGTLDASFDIGTGFNDEINSIVVLGDGKILVGGYFTTYKGTAVSRIIRLNSNGSLDTTFNTVTGPDSYVTAMAVTNTGKIYISGNFTHIGATAAYRMARLNGDGSLDTAFVTTGGGLNDPAYKIIPQSDGKVLVCGTFSMVYSTSSPYLGRFNANGTRDTGFNVGNGPSARVWDMLLLDDGRIQISGEFTQYNSIERNRIALINADGSLDSNIGITDGPNGRITIMVRQTDGKLLLAGTFSSYAGTSLNRLARLNTDGSLDTSFDPGTSANGTIYCMTLSSVNRVLIGGLFSAYNGVTRNNIARLK